MVLARGRGGGNVELLFNVYEVSVWEDEEVLEMPGGAGYLPMRMDLL